MNLAQDREQVKEIIDQVLSRKEFQEGREMDAGFLQSILEKLGNLLERFLSWIGDFFSWLFSGISINGSRVMGFSGLRAVIVIIGIALAVSLCTVLVILVVRYLQKRSRDQKPGDFSEELVSYVEEPEAPHRLAEQYRQAGEFRMAFRYLFIALLIQLNQKGFIEIHPAKTNRIYRREVCERAPELGKRCELFFDAFALYWYGGRPVGEEELGRWFLLYESLCAYEGRTAS